MPVSCAIVGRQSEDPAGGFPFGSPDLERYRIRRNLHPIRQQLGGKEFSLSWNTEPSGTGTMGSESNTAYDPGRAASPFPKFPHRIYPLCVPCVLSRRLMRHFLAALI